MQWNNNNRQAILCADLTARGVACFCVRSSLLSARKNDIIGVTNIFKEAGCMGIYVNPNNVDFQRCLQQDIYVDKTNLT